MYWTPQLYPGWLIIVIWASLRSDFTNFFNILPKSGLTKSFNTGQICVHCVCLWCRHIFMSDNVFYSDILSLLYQRPKNSRIGSPKLHFSHTIGKIISFSMTAQFWASCDPCTIFIPRTILRCSYIRPKAQKTQKAPYHSFKPHQLQTPTLKTLFKSPNSKPQPLNPP